MKLVKGMYPRPVPTFKISAVSKNAGQDSAAIKCDLNHRPANRGHSAFLTGGVTIFCRSKVFHPAWTATAQLSTQSTSGPRPCVSW